MNVSCYALGNARSRSARESERHSGNIKTKSRRYYQSSNAKTRDAAICHWSHPHQSFLHRSNARQAGRFNTAMIWVNRDRNEGRVSSSSTDVLKFQLKPAVSL